MPAIADGGRLMYCPPRACGAARLAMEGDDGLGSALFASALLLIAVIAAVADGTRMMARRASWW